MKFVSYEHHIDFELPREVSEVVDVIENLDFPITPGCTGDLRNQILEKLGLKGWSGSVQIAPNKSLTVTSMRSETALCIQTGNMSRFYADLLKLQYLFLANKCSRGVYVIPTKYCADLIGSNIANFERFTAELQLFGQIISIPLYVIGFDEES